MAIGIYKLNFKGTDKVYIGQSRRLEKRLAEHIALLKASSHAKKMQAAYKEFGEPSIEVLCECSIEELNDFENETIEIWNAVDNGFNSAYKAGEYAIVYGDMHGNSKYTNDKIIEVFKYLVEHPGVHNPKVSELLNISIHVVSDIASGTSHTWLSQKYPVEYAALMSTKGIRTIGENNYNSVYSNSRIIEVFNELVSNTCSNLVDIAKKHDFDIVILRSIADGNRHKWLKQQFPEKYAHMLSLKYTNIRRSNGNSALAKGITYPEILSPEGHTFTITNVRAFAREHNLNSSHLSKVLNGKAMTHKGWKLA